jgi:mannose-1-phosphate guanylyltransferase
VLRADEQADRYGSIDIDADGRVCRFLDTPAPASPSNDVTKLMFTGVQVLETEIFDYMESETAAKKFSTTKNTFPRMLTAGAALYGFRFDGFWQDLGTPAAIKQAEERLESGHAKLHYL